MRTISTTKEIIKHFSVWVWISLYTLTSIAIQAQDIQLFLNEPRPLPMTGNPALAQIDWNGDEYPDLLGLFRSPAVANRSLSLGIMINDGKAGFQQAFDLGSYPDWVNITNAELDGDPASEIIAMTTSTIFTIDIGSDHTVHVQPLLYEHTRPILQREVIKSALAHDTNNDGITETFIITLSTAIVMTQRTYLLNQDSMKLEIQSNITPLDWSEHPRFRQYENGEAVAVLENVSNEVISGPIWKNLRTGETGKYVVNGVNPYVWDLDADGIDDFLGINSAQMWFFKGLPGGGFETGLTFTDEPPTFVKHNFPRGAKSVSGDLNEDGVPDTVEVFFEYVHPSVAPIYMTVSFGNSPTAPENYQIDLGRSDGFANILFLYDFNHDSHIDLLKCGPGGPDRMFFGKGNGYFNDPIYPGGRIAYDFSAKREMADFNNDGLPDFLLLADSPDFQPYAAFAVSFGNPNGTFRLVKHYNYPLGGNWGIFGQPNVQVGDVNGDQYDDIWFVGDRLLLINQFRFLSNAKNWDMYR